VNEITPMSVKRMPRSRALALPPSLELDLYVMANVLDGPDEMLEIENFGRLPGFSRKFADCQMLIIMAVNELGPLSTYMSPDLFSIAVDAGFMVRKRPCVVWRSEAGGFIGYGRNFEESLCKLLIVAKCEKS
jgi:hypothetical protein